MESAENEMRAMVAAERAAEKYRDISHDPQFSEFMNLFLHLVEKYGRQKLLAVVLSDYRNKKWIHLRQLLNEISEQTKSQQKGG